MASREVQKLLFDMKQAGELIETFVVGRSFEEYHGVGEADLPVRLAEVKTLLEAP
jgi:hypothetical protein